MAVQPLSDRILVERIEEDEQKVGSIYVPDTAKEKSQEAKVIAVGPGRLNDKGERLSMDIKAGDRILVSKYGGTEVKVDGKDFVILRQDDVLAVIG